MTPRLARAGVAHGHFASSRLPDLDPAGRISWAVSCIFKDFTPLKKIMIQSNPSTCRMLVRKTTVQPSFIYKSFMLRPVGSQFLGSFLHFEGSHPSKTGSRLGQAHEHGFQNGKTAVSRIRKACGFDPSQFSCARGELPLGSRGAHKFLGPGFLTAWILTT